MINSALQSVSFHLNNMVMTHLKSYYIQFEVHPSVYWNWLYLFFFPVLLQAVSSVQTLVLLDHWGIDNSLNLGFLVVLEYHQ